MTTKHTPQQTLAGHTPGPWKVITNSDRQLTISTVKPLIGRQYITHIAQVNFTPVDSPEANANLIAAAPEMLEALVDAETVLGENLQFITDLADLAIRQRDSKTLKRLEQLNDGWVRLVKAIAKARGEV